MQGLFLVVVFIVVISAVIGAVSQVLKGVGQAAAAPPESRPRPRNADAGRPKAGEIDRFLEEIDRLRRKKAQDGADPPVAKPVARRAAEVPTAEPVRRRRPKAEAIPVATPVPPPLTDTPEPPPMPSLRDLPTAPPPARTAPPTTEFGRALAALLTTRQAVPLAVVLHEVLGPPKCKQGRGGPPTA